MRWRVPLSLPARAVRRAAADTPTRALSGQAQHQDADLTFQYGDLMPQSKDFRVLGSVTHGHLVKAIAVLKNYELTRG
jgi:hypothetical protein